jgi:hypothetical protein
VLFREALEGDADAAGLSPTTISPGADRRAHRWAAAFVRTPDSTPQPRERQCAPYGCSARWRSAWRCCTAKASPSTGCMPTVACSGRPAQRFLAAALAAPVAVGDTASEGGAWGMAVLAAFRLAAAGDGSASLSAYLDRCRVRGCRGIRRRPEFPRTSRASPPTSTATAPASPSRPRPSPYPSRRGEALAHRPKEDHDPHHLARPLHRLVRDRQPGPVRRGDAPAGRRAVPASRRV